MPGLTASEVRAIVREEIEAEKARAREAKPDMSGLHRAIREAIRHEMDRQRARA